MNLEIAKLIAEADERLKGWPPMPDTPDSWRRFLFVQMRDALERQEAELARLRAPLGDEGLAIMKWLRENLPPCSCWNMASGDLRFHVWECKARRASEAATYIERLAAALAALTAFMARRKTTKINKRETSCPL